jgi:ADP-ribose pyrophosphatase YjhB (NUDIX family)
MITHQDTNIVFYETDDLSDHIAIGAIIKNNKNQILMQDHVKRNVWTIPIGKVDDNENIQHALIRELKEEIGITIKKVKQISINKRVYPVGTYFINVTEHLYEVLEYDGIPKNLEPLKHRSIQWMNLTKIKKIKNISNFTKEVLRHYAQ